MTDYTPLDHEVRNRAIIGGREIGVPETEAEQQYDRWLAATIRQAKAEALREFADAHRMPWVIFRRADESPVTVGDLMRETADRIEQP